MVTKICKVCNLTLDISEFKKNHGKCKKCYKKHASCKHKKHKSGCLECNPNLLCNHGIWKRSCRECSPQNFCKHKKYRISCRECNPKVLCKHNKRKKDCPKCTPSLLCEHDTRKKNCYICKPQKFCIYCKHIHGKKRYIKSLNKKIKCCASCFYHFHPNDKIPRRFKSKQHYFNKKLIEEFGDIFEYDRAIKCGCSQKRPDWFLDCFNYSIIVELDENQHKYNSCDEKRIMQLFQDLGNRKLVLIRINPDKYKNGDIKISNCFKFDKNNTIKCVTKEFDERFNKLVERIEHFLNNEPTKELTIEKLFFDR